MTTDQLIEDRQILACDICGAAVRTQDRAKHLDWHATMRTILRMLNNK